MSERTTAETNAEAPACANYKFFHLLKIWTGWGSVRRFVGSIFCEKKIDISIPIQCWTYYASAFLTRDVWQGKRPSVWEVHSRCDDIKGWRFGWRYVGAVWGREKITK